jgi:CO/xanthine dehydrogenase FAD-binding subunit
MIFVESAERLPGGSMSLQIVRADSVRAAAAILAQDRSAQFLAGGTLAVRAWNAGDVSIGCFVLCDGLGLDRIRIDAGRAEIGAAVTMAGILAAPELGFLHCVAREIGGPAVRAMATVGGNLFAPHPYGDFTVALLALGAEVSVESTEGRTTTALEAFLARRGSVRGIVRHVGFAMPAAGAFRYTKVVRRRPHGAPVLCVATLLPVADGRVRGARVAYGAMAQTPIRAPAVEQALEGQFLDREAIADAVAVAAEGTAPVDDPQASAWYRLAILPVHLGRLLQA